MARFREWASSGSPDPPSLSSRLGCQNLASHEVRKPPSSRNPGLATCPSYRGTRHASRKPRSEAISTSGSKRFCVCGNTLARSGGLLIAERRHVDPRCIHGILAPCTPAISGLAYRECAAAAGCDIPHPHRYPPSLIRLTSSLRRTRSLRGVPFILIPGPVRSDNPCRVR